MRQALFSSPAVDENDQPVTDETGRQLTMYEASGRAEFKSNMKQLDKLLSDISNVKSQTDLNKIKKDLDTYDLNFLKPAQLAQIYATINEIGASIKQIRASTDLIGQQTKTERERTNLTGQQKETEKARTKHEENLRDISGKDLENYDVNKWIERSSKFVSPILQAVGMAVKR